MPINREKLTQQSDAEEERRAEDETAKQKKWEEQLKKIETLKDGLGKGVDEGIKETVAAMQVLGILTRQSCQGHLNWGEAAPWVRMDFPPEIHALSRQYSELFDVFDKISEGDKDFQRVADEFHKVGREEKRLRALELKKLTLFLEDFYAERNVPYDQRLILDARGELTNQGGFLQITENESQRGENLYRYQSEMKAFTEFLKQKFFSQ